MSCGGLTHRRTPPPAFLFPNQQCQRAEPKQLPPPGSNRLGSNEPPRRGGRCLVPPEFQVNRYFQSFLQRVGPGSFSRGKHRRCVSRAPMKNSEAGWPPSPFVTRSSGPPRRGGRLLNHPVLKSTGFSEVSAARPIQLISLSKNLVARTVLKRL